ILGTGRKSRSSMAKSADSIGPHRDRLVLEPITETADVFIANLNPQTIQKGEEMIVRGMGDRGQGAQLLKVDDGLVVSILYIGVHPLVEIERPVERRVVVANHSPE